MLARDLGRRSWRGRIGGFARSRRVAAVAGRIVGPLRPRGGGSWLRSWEMGRKGALDLRI